MKKLHRIFITIEDDGKDPLNTKNKFITIKELRGIIKELEWKIAGLKVTVVSIKTEKQND